jgi:hypothetical protein
MRGAIERKAVTDIVPVPEAQNPMQMLATAVARGTDPAQLQALMDLQERWEKGEARKAFVVAINAFKANPPQIVKDKLVEFQTSKGTTRYKHALSGQASEQIGAALAAHGISHRWEVEQAEKIRVTCILTHALGHSERCTLQASPDDSGGKNSIQAVGSTVSYLQRYSLFAATGLVPVDADDDAKGGAATHAMDERRVTELREGIAATKNRKEAESLWQSIAAECTKAGDVASYAELKSAVAAHVKALEAA